MAAPKIVKDVRDYIAGNVSEPVSIAALTPSPINQYAVVEYPGMSNVKTFSRTIPVLENAFIQIQVRHASNQQAMLNTYAIKDLLDGLQDVTINSTVYTWFNEISRPRMLDRQDDGSVIWIYEIHVQARR